ncbi:MAG: M10 family metallopeptidase C-terminal domain-containing protein, partial [Natronospirillum sp.]
LSGFSQSQIISLVEGTFSSVGALTDNLSIAYGAVIENAVGGSGNDMITGNASANMLNGGGGNDSINGGSGNDRIVYDAADNATNVTGGADIDTLVVIGGAVPLAYDLVAGSFEFAEHQQTDNSGQFWSTITDTYNSAWQLLTRDGVVDDGRVWHAEYDVADAFWYETTTNWYQFDGGPLQYVDYTRTDGSYITQVLDFDNSQWWSTFGNHYNAAGQNFLTDGNADDGRYWVASFDVAETEWWSYYTLWFDTVDAATRQLINAQGIVDDGRSWTTTYDVNDIYTWSEQTVWYDTSGEIDYIVTV